MSNLARKFDFLQERAERKPLHSASIDTLSDTTKKPGIGHLKEFYLQRLAKTEPNAAARLGGTVKLGQDTNAGPCGGGCGAAASPTSAGAPARPNFACGGVKDIEDLEVMCNNCFNLIRSSEAANCTGEPSSCPMACRSGPADAMAAEKPVGQIALIDLKLKKLRKALDDRLQDASSKINVMRHLTQLKYHIDTASKWQLGCSEIGALSDHTLQQVKQLTATSRVLAPAVYIFSKRITNVVVQKERELRKASLQQSSQPVRSNMGNDSMAFGDLEHTIGAESVADVKSVVSELDSDCGTQYAETVVTQDGPSTDVGNVQDANDYLNLKNEDEQRRWFYAQTLTVKLSLADKTRARKILISDLYGRVREENVPIDGWVDWIRANLMPEDTPAEGGKLPVEASPSPSPARSTGATAGSPAPSGGGLSSGYPGGGVLGGLAHATPSPARSEQNIDRTVPVPAVSPGGASYLSRTSPVTPMQHLQQQQQLQHSAMQTPTMQRPGMPVAGGMSYPARPGLGMPSTFGLPRKM